MHLVLVLSSPSCFFLLLSPSFACTSAFEFIKFAAKLKCFCLPFQMHLGLCAECTVN